MSLVNLTDIELRLVSSGCPADHQRPTPRQTANALFPGGAERIDDDIDAATVGLLHHPIGKWTGRVVNGILGTMRDCLLTLPLGAARGKDRGARPARECQRRRAD